MTGSRGRGGRGGGQGSGDPTRQEFRWASRECSCARPLIRMRVGSFFGEEGSGGRKEEWREMCVGSFFGGGGGVEEGRRLGGRGDERI